MLSETDKKELLKKLNESKKEIADLKKSLNEINNQKESWFEKKNECTAQISDLIKNVNELKKKRNEFTGKVKELKQKRKELSDKIKKAINEVKAFEKERNSIQNKYDIKEDPAAIAAAVERLEFKIETEVMSFDKEQQLMKKIKDLKKQVEEAKGLGEIWGRVRDKSREIKELKKQAEDAHRKVQQLASESQKCHEEMIEKSKQIDELRVKEEDAYRKFFELKQKFSEVNESLKKRLPEINDLRDKLDLDREETKKEKAAKQEKRLNTKSLEVKDKIRKGKKLTTEDLLVFQKTNMDFDYNDSEVESEKKNKDEETVPSASPDKKSEEIRVGDSRKESSD